jgi:hypothetical protein
MNLFSAKETRNITSKFINGITDIPVKDLIKAEYRDENHPHKIFDINDNEILMKVNYKDYIIIRCNNSIQDLYETYYYFYCHTEGIINEELPEDSILMVINIDSFNPYDSERPIHHFKLIDDESKIVNKQLQAYHLVVGNFKSNSIVNKYVKKIVELLKLKKISDMKEKYKDDSDFMIIIKKIESLIQDPNFIESYYQEEEKIKKDLENQQKMELANQK